VTHFIAHVVLHTLLLLLSVFVLSELLRFGWVPPSLKREPLGIITSHAGAVAMYCDQYVCVCLFVCLRASPEPYARSLPNVLCMLPIALARSFPGEGEGVILGVFVPIYQCIVVRHSSIWNPYNNG